MKTHTFIALYITLLTTAKASFVTSNADPTPVTTEDLSKQLNENLNNSLKKQYEKDLITFQNAVKDAVEDHKNDTKIVKIGGFNITTQTSCKLAFVVKPVMPTQIAKECFKANASAESIALLLIKAAPENPPNPETIINAMNSCELNVKWVKEFSITNECWNGTLPTAYSHVWQTAKNTLEKDGYKYDQSSKTFKKSGETGMMNVSEFKTTQDKLQNTKPSITDAAKGDVKA